MINKRQLEVLEHLGHTKQDVDGNYSYPQLIGWREIEEFAGHLLLQAIQHLDQVDKHQCYTSYDMQLVLDTTAKLRKHLRQEFLC